jgi:hydrogenase expression/formation protein HypC
MCLAIPIRVNELLPDGMARVTLDGVSMTVSVALLDVVAVGDYVILHAGFALARIDAEEAEHTLALMREAGVPVAAVGGHAGAQGEAV